MKTVGTLLATFLISALVTVVGYHAVIGAAALYLTNPTVYVSEECDKTQRFDGQVWCMNLVPAEDQPLNTYQPPELIEMAGPIDTDAIADTYNPQETIDTKEVQGGSE